MANNLGIALGASVDELNTQRRMTMAEDEAARQKEQFGWARTNFEQQQAIKAAQDKVLAEADALRKQYATDPVAAATAVSKLHSGSGWDGEATSAVSKGLDGKIYVTRYNGKDKALLSPNDIERRELTPQLFNDALASHIAYRMAEADPRNYLKNYADLRKTEQGERQLDLTEQGQKNYLDVSKAGLEQGDRHFGVTSAETTRHNKASEGLQRSGLGLQAQGLQLQKDRIAIEDKRAINEGLRLDAQLRREADDRAYNRSKDANEVVDNAVKTYAQVAGPEKAAEYGAGVNRYLALNFKPGKGDDAKAKAYQGIRNYELEVALNDKGQHWLTSEKPWDGATKTMWEVDRSSTLGDSVRNVWGETRFRNKQTGQVIDMGDIRRLSPDQQATFLGYYADDGRGNQVFVPGRVIDSKGNPVNVLDTLGQREQREKSQGLRAVESAGPTVSYARPPRYTPDPPSVSEPGFNPFSQSITASDLNQGLRARLPSTR